MEVQTSTILEFECSRCSNGWIRAYRPLNAVNRAMPVSRHLQELIADAARTVGRSYDDVRPYVNLLEENWFDTVDSLRTIAAPDLQQLGLPLRFARELLSLAGAKGGAGGAPPPPPPALAKPAAAAAGVPAAPPPAPAVPAAVRVAPPVRAPPPVRAAPAAVQAAPAAVQAAPAAVQAAPAAVRAAPAVPTPPAPTPKAAPVVVPPILVPQPLERHRLPQHPQQAKGSRGKSDGKEDWKDRRDEWNWEKGQGLTKGKSKRDRGGKGKSQGKPLDTASSQVQGLGLHTHKIFLDIDSPDPSFGLNGRLIGENGQNVKHIQDITGVTVHLGGQGSGDRASEHEQLHVLLRSGDAPSLEEAIRITNDLLDTVLEQYTAWQGGRAQGQESQKPQKGPGKSGDGHKGFGKLKGNARRGHFAARSWNQKGGYAHYPDEPANKRSRAH